MADRIEGQLVNSAQNMGLASLPNYINHYKGVGPHLVTNPFPDAAKYMIIDVEAGSFRLQPGDKTGTIGPYSIPSGTLTDGTGTFALEEFETYVFTTPNELTVVGNSAGAILTVAWL